jgi:hypothetical protein
MDQARGRAHSLQQAALNNSLTHAAPLRYELALHQHDSTCLQTYVRMEHHGNTQLSTAWCAFHHPGPLSLSARSLMSQQLRHNTSSDPDAQQHIIRDARLHVPAACVHTTAITQLGHTIGSNTILAVPHPTTQPFLVCSRGLTPWVPTAVQALVLQRPSVPAYTR